ncbi:MAG: PHP domain-containing protein [Pseudomonadales bacterium]|nr:PHP domain-containing protein [Pseudomonadales bacterium]MCP5330060.1 PHP domain-containing protein [Pseudomonadales bacterium]MCP5343030.1 PHP domain-containing protein [Pseudomonadales bacterium]
MLADLHSHTHYSDGTLSPQALLARARERQVDWLAITDHDSTDALHLLRECPPAQETPRLIAGVELSTLWEGHEIHIVGLGFDIDHPGLQALLLRQQTLRRERMQAMDMNLQKAGHCGLMDYLNTLPCTSLSRNHVADFLIARGIVKSKDQAFKRFLGDRGRIASAAHWCSIGEAVDTLHAAGGLAVMAHPTRYRVGRMQFRRLLGEFAQSGGDGLEVSYSNLDPARMQHLATLCLEYGFWASTGSDFHHPGNQWMDVGRFRHLPGELAERAIWLHPGWPGCSL